MPVAGVAPAPAVPPIVIAAGLGGDPHLAQRRLRVDDDLALVGEDEFEQAASALRVDVDHVFVEPAVACGLDASEQGAGLADVVGVVERHLRGA